jgi:hypothetical protein
MIRKWYGLICEIQKFRRLSTSKLNEGFQSLFPSFLRCGWSLTSVADVDGLPERGGKNVSVLRVCVGESDFVITVEVVVPWAARGGSNAGSGHVVGRTRYDRVQWLGHASK